MNVNRRTCSLRSPVLQTTLITRLLNPNVVIQWRQFAYLYDVYLTSYLTWVNTSLILQVNTLYYSKSVRLWTWQATFTLASLFDTSRNVKSASRNARLLLLWCSSFINTQEYHRVGVHRGLQVQAASRKNMTRAWFTLTSHVIYSMVNVTCRKRKCSKVGPCDC